MIKTVGVSVILAASFSAAVYNSFAYKKKVSFVEGILDLISFIRSRILYFRDPLDHIYSDFENKALDRSGFLDELRRSGLSEALKIPAVSGLFEKRIYAQLKSFAAGLGKTSADEQINSCNMCIDMMKTDVEKLRREMPEKTHMYSSLCIIAGLGAALLLI